MLNEEQKRAVHTVDGRVLVLAGAGSGKTRVIVQRTAHLIQNLGVDPHSIVGLTFTNKAAAEMRKRLQEIVTPQQARQVTLATFHSFCMQILRKEIHHLGFTQNFSLYDEGDIQRILKFLAKEILGVNQDLPSLEQTKQAITKALNKGKFDADTHTWHDEFTKELFSQLQVTLRAQNALNFDNLINLTIQLFEEHPDVLAKYQKKYRYFMIDEYQDTNPAQFHLAELLAQKNQNLCVVGDDDQSIYGWRGAEIANILQFQADHVIKLEQNYRSTPLILEAANAVIACNQNRHEKKLWSASHSSHPIEVFNAPTEMDEANAIVQRILKYKEEGYAFGDMAILYRSNALSRNLEMALMQASWKKENQWVRGIPYEIFGGLEFSERSEIKDLLSYLRVIANPKDEEALLRIVNVPKRGISATFLDEITKLNRLNQISLLEIFYEIAEGKRLFPKNPKGVAGIQAFLSLYEKAKQRFAKPPLHEAVAWLIEEIPYKKAIDDDVKSEKMRQFKWENIQECINAVAAFEMENEPHLQDFIANTALARPVFANHINRSSQHLLQMMTLHSAKGLEFPICFIIGLEDHILPHEKSRELVGLEEERRLFYVGITRAQKKLTLSMSRTRMRMGKAHPTQPSRFLFEIPKHLIEPAHYKLP